MDEILCQTCQNFRQHYSLDEQRIFRVFCGHCTLSIGKRKTPHTKACEEYIPVPPDHEPFVSKEYLSKELLQYILDMDLLPEIADATIHEPDLLTEMK